MKVIGKRSRGDGFREAPRSVASSMEWQEMKFMLVRVGLPVLLVALAVQLVPDLLRLF